jgi:hypothetical protein
MKKSCLPSIVQNAVGRKICNSSFADHLERGNDGIGDGGAIERVLG